MPWINCAKINQLINDRLDCNLQNLKNGSVRDQKQMDELLTERSTEGVQGNKDLKQDPPGGVALAGFGTFSVANFAELALPGCLHKTEIVV